MRYFGKDVCVMCKMDGFFSQCSSGADPIYSTNYVAGRATGRRRLGTKAGNQPFQEPLDDDDTSTLPPLVAYVLLCASMARGYKSPQA